MYLKFIISVLLTASLAFSSVEVLSFPGFKNKTSKNNSSLQRNKKLKRQNALTKDHASALKQKLRARNASSSKSKKSGVAALTATAATAAVATAAASDVPDYVAPREVRFKKKLRNIAKHEQEYQAKLDQVPIRTPSDQFTIVSNEVIQGETDDANYTQGDRYEAFKPLALSAGGFLKDVRVNSKPLDNIQDFKVAVNSQGQIIHASSGEVIDTPRIESEADISKSYKYTMNTEGDIFIFPAFIDGEEVTHFAGAVKNVIAAGEVQVSNGSLAAIGNESGHFQPPTFRTELAIAELERQGLKSDSGTYDVTAIDPGNIRSANIGLTDLTKFNRLLRNHLEPEENPYFVLEKPQDDEQPISQNVSGSDEYQELNFDNGEPRSNDARYQALRRSVSADTATNPNLNRPLPSIPTTPKNPNQGRPLPEIPATSTNPNRNRPLPEIPITNNSAVADNLTDNPLYESSDRLVDNPLYESSDRLVDNPLYEPSDRLVDNPLYESNSNRNRPLPPVPVNSSLGDSNPNLNRPLPPVPSATKTTQAN